MNKFEKMNEMINKECSDEYMARICNVSDKTLQKMKTIKEFIDKGFSGKEISAIINMDYDVFIDFCKKRGIHFKQHRTNCFTCDNFYINFDGKPNCNNKYKCNLQKAKNSKYIPINYQNKTKCLVDIIGKYFNLSLTNDEAIKFYDDCKRFYENEISKS